MNSGNDAVFKPLLLVEAVSVFLRYLKSPRIKKLLCEVVKKIQMKHSDFEFD